MLKDWKKSIDELKDVSEEDKLKLFISNQTMAGITITSKFFSSKIKAFVFMATKWSFFLRPDYYTFKKLKGVSMFLARHVFT